MNKEDFLKLHKQYSEDNAISSFIKSSDPIFQELLEAEMNDDDTAIIWTLERLKDSIGYDNSVDGIENDPWLSICLIDEYSGRECFKGLPKESNGVLGDIRKFVLKWGEEKGLI